MKLHLVLLSLLSLAHSLSWGDSTQADGEPPLDNFWASNCGLTVLLAVGVLYDREIDPDPLFARFGLHASEPLTFQELSKEFEMIDLQASGYKGLSGEDMTKRLDSQQSVAVIHLGYHFVVAWKANDQEFAWMDYPEPIKRLSPQDFQARFDRDSTGKALFVRDKNGKKPLLLPKRSPSKWAEDRDLSVPEKLLVTFDEDGGRIIIVELPVRNAGSTPVTNLYFSGSCSCFLGARTAVDIVPKGEGLVHLQFDKSAIQFDGSSSSSTDVLLVDPATEKPYTAIRIEFQSGGN